jgi:1-acyl-sn-glycerol-3-phosphate acyltransferase
MSINPGRSRTVFLEEVPVEGLHMKDVAMLKKKVFDMMEEKLVEYKVLYIAHPHV